MVIKSFTLKGGNKIIRLEDNRQFKSFHDNDDKEKVLIDGILYEFSVTTCKLTPSLFQNKMNLVEKRETS